MMRTFILLQDERQKDLVTLSFILQTRLRVRRISLGRRVTLSQRKKTKIRILK